MSGPKYSTAYIRELQRLKQLEKELEDQIENSKRNQAISDIQRLLNEINQCCGNIDVCDYDRIIAEANEIIPNSQLLSQLKAVVSELKQIQKTSCDLSGDSKILLSKYKNLQKISIRLKNLQVLAKDLKKQISKEATDTVQDARELEFLNMEWEDTGEKIEVIPSDLQQLYCEVLELLANATDYEEQKKAIDDSIMHVGDLTYKRKQLELRKQAIEVEHNSSQNNIEVLELTNELQSLYILLGYDAKPIPVTVDELKAAIELAMAELKQKQASEYIAHCIHKVFEELGYDLLEDSIVSNNSGVVERDYYEFGDDSLINVSMSSKGQMLFEVVGDGDENSMDESRASKLENEMRRFCPNYAEIKKRLQEAYGISLEDEHLCEPDKKYAKAIDVGADKGKRRAGTAKKKRYIDQ